MNDRDIVSVNLRRMLALLDTDEVIAISEVFDNAFVAGPCSRGLWYAGRLDSFIPPTMQ